MSSISKKRIQKEFQNMLKDPSNDFVANPIKDDMFCWHFTIRGPPDTEFEGGLYHGIIKLPMSYPNRPPNIMFLTPNGRFDINMDVCLSMTKYHKEEWQAAWTIRSMLEAIIAFFPIREDHDAIGALESSVESRKYYAKQSIKYKCDICGPIANLLKPIEKLNNSNNNTNNENKNDNKNNNENKNINDNTNNTYTSNINKNIKIIPSIIKKDIDSSSNSSLSLNQTGKFQFKREIMTSPYSKTKKIILNKNNNKEILLNSKEEKEDNINNNEQEELLFNYINPEKDQNSLLQSLIDDIDYIDIKKSIKCHGNKTNEEIESNLIKKHNLNNFFRIKKIFEKDFDIKIDEEENKSADDDDDNDENYQKSIKKGLLNRKMLLNEKEKCEKKMEENIKYINYFSRKNYEDIRGRNKRYMNIVMICIMVFILICYFICSKYQISINKFLKTLLL